MTRRLITEFECNTDTASYTLTGVGAGKLDLVAEVDMDDSTFVSTPYEVLDCLYYDDATTNSKNDACWNSVSAMSRGDEYTSIVPSSTVTVYTSLLDNNHLEVDVNGSFGGTSNFISIRDSSANVLLGASKTSLSMSNNTWYHITIDIIDGVATIKNITNNTSVSDTISSIARFYFRVGNGESLKFKNLKAYSI